jgi:hypothetical protein
MMPRFPTMDELYPAPEPEQFDPASDPLGIALQQRGMDSYWADRAEHPNTPMSGPLPDPKWQGFFQAIKEAASGRQVKFAGGPSPVGSNQFRGASVQPPGAPSAAFTAEDDVPFGATPSPNARLAALSGLRNARSPQANRYPYTGKR